jgi:hypothetical protein
MDSQTSGALPIAKNETAFHPPHEERGHQQLAPCRADVAPSLNRRVGMKVHCDLISCHTYQLITSIDLEMPKGHFGVTHDNPFPASTVWTASFFNDGEARVTYIARTAIADYGSWEEDARRSA